MEKEDGKIRLTTNLIKLNQIKPLDRYSLPNIEEILAKLKGFEYFSKVDLKEGFFQIPLREEDCKKTAFRIKNKLYEWTRMPMGFKNSPAIFQRFMDNVLEDDIGVRCFVYVDDILVFSNNKDTHLEDLKNIIKKLIKMNLIGNREKSEFMKKKVSFLGYTISKDLIQPMEEKAVAILGYEPPKDIESVRRFLGLINYYRKFIPNCSTIAAPLTKLLKKDELFI